MICSYCGEDKPDVCERPNPYENDVNNDPDATHIACDECDDKCADDI